MNVMKIKGVEELRERLQL